MIAYSFFPLGKDVNKLVKTFIVSETLVWSGYNFIFPIIALFIVDNIQNASIETAATAFSVYLLTRVAAELFSGRYLTHTSVKRKMIILILGQAILTIAYLALSQANTITHLFASYFLVGLGLGFSTPAKLAVFSTHLDKNKESKEWGYWDAMSFLGMAIAGIIAGYVAKTRGFESVFYLAATINVLSIVPLILFFNKYIERN